MARRERIEKMAIIDKRAAKNTESSPSSHTRKRRSKQSSVWQNWKQSVRVGQVELEVMLREVQVALGAQKSRIVLL